MFACEIAAMRMKSYARVMNAANVEAKGTSPRTCIPTAAATICCSAMYISKKRSGATFLKSSACVELLTSASSTTMSARARPSAASASPYALRVATGSVYVLSSGFRAGGRVAGVQGSGLLVGNVRDATAPSSARASFACSGSRALPCQPSLSSRNETPFPLTVFATITVGRSARRARPSAPSMASGSWPSITIASQPKARTRAA